MQTKTPFLFAMPPLFAWPLAITTSVALIIAVHLVFSEPSMATEGDAEVAAEATAVEGADEAPVAGQMLSTTGVTLLIGVLILSVGLIPMMARRKRMKVLWWSVGGVGTGFMHLLLGGLPLVHPLMLLLALVYMRSSPPVELAASPDVRSVGSLSTGAVEAQPEPRSASSPRRRVPRRRRRPRF
ncbi:MAG: hypothetical protein OXC99_05265 [Chloroflexi bacterium]|nr:hypothetical protein [Chloroflexota bacterium]